MLLYYFLFAFPPIALVSLILYTPYYFYCRKTRGHMGLPFHLVKYALIGSVISLLYLTVLWYWPNISFFPEYRFLNLRPFVWVTEVYAMGTRRMLEQLVTNIVMFIPYGFLLPTAIRLLRSPWRALGVVLGTTVLIETVQYCIGRSADIDDVIMNFLGGCLGYALFALCRRAVRSGRSKGSPVKGAD